MNQEVIEDNDETTTSRRGKQPRGLATSSFLLLRQLILLRMVLQRPIVYAKRDLPKSSSNASRFHVFKNLDECHCKRRRDLVGFFYFGLNDLLCSILHLLHELFASSRGFERPKAARERLLRVAVEPWKEILEDVGRPLQTFWSFNFYYM